MLGVPTYLQNSCLDELMKPVDTEYHESTNKGPGWILAFFILMCPHTDNIAVSFSVGRRREAHYALDSSS